MRFRRHHAAPRHCRLPVFLLVLVASWVLLAAPVRAEERCGPEIKKKKKVEVIEVDTENPKRALDELEAERGTELEVVAEDLVESSSNPVRTARIEAAYRGCRLLVAGEVVKRDADSVITIRSGTRGAPSTRRRWTKVSRVLFVVEKPREEAGADG